MLDIPAIKQFAHDRGKTDREVWFQKRGDYPNTCEHFASESWHRAVADIVYNFGRTLGLTCGITEFNASVTDVWEIFKQYLEGFLTKATTDKVDMASLIITDEECNGKTGAHG